jgi:hypothetical protein
MWRLQEGHNSHVEIAGSTAAQRSESEGQKLRGGLEPADCAEVMAG